jgi:alpha,alpha-trehalase
MACRELTLLGALCLGCTPAKAPAPPALSAPNAAPAAQSPERLTLSFEDARALGCSVLAAFDDDGDARLTVDDASSAGDWPRTVQAVGIELTFQSLAEASRLTQDVFGRLRDAERASQSTVEVDLARSRLSEAEFLNLQIRERYWRGLTRVITTNEALLSAILRDPKVGTQSEQRLELCGVQSEAPEVAAAAPMSPLYVPETDPGTLQRFGAFAGEHEGFVVRPVPRAVDAAWVDELTSTRQHGLLMLAPDTPFVVPGGRFNEMYGWDSFFITWGLSASEQSPSLLRAMADNQRYQIEHYGRILNANRTYYLTRSQPPFFTELVGFASAASGQSWRDSPEGTVWFARQTSAAIREYQSVWAAPPHATTLCDGDTCLARYHGSGHGEPPEVEPGHFDWVYQKIARERGLCRQKGDSPKQLIEFARCASAVRDRYLSGRLKSRELDAFFVHDRCMRESGHDTSYRWYDEKDGDRCADYVTVDLNVLLLRYELDLAASLAQGRQVAWCERARRRAGLIQKFLWNEQRGLFLDYDVARGEQHDYVSATTLYPLWLGGNNACGVELVSREQAARLVAAALPLLERPGGLSATARESVERVAKARVVEVDGDTATVRELGRQWDYPNGWAPHQMIAWRGLELYGFHDDAQRLEYEWLYTIAKNAADYHGTVPEKFNVETRSHRVFEEYGNVGSDFAYITEEGFGWMNASFVVGWNALDDRHKGALERLLPPEELQAHERADGDVRPAAVERPE